jgi:MFS family permease
MVILSFMIQYMLRVNISIAIVEMVSKNDSNSTKTHGPLYDWNENQKNDILGIFFWGYIITQIPAGRFSEIFGTKIVVGTGVALLSNCRVEILHRHVFRSTVAVNTSDGDEVVVVYRHINVHVAHVCKCFGSSIDFTIMRIFDR